MGELRDLPWLSTVAGVNKVLLGHVEHELPVLEEVGPEVLLEDEEVLNELVLDIVSVGLLDALLPHAHELPRSELLEEGEVLDVVV